MVLLPDSERSEFAITTTSRDLSPPLCKFGQEILFLNTSLIRNRKSISCKVKLIIFVFEKLLVKTIHLYSQLVVCLIK